MMKTLILAATAIVLAAPVLAQVPPPSTQPAAPTTALPSTSLDQKTNVKVDAFLKADGDKNGALSIAEVKLADASVTQADFDKADADKSKSLSKVEFDKWAMAKKPATASAPGQ